MVRESHDDNFNVDSVDVASERLSLDKVIALFLRSPFLATLGGRFPQTVGILAPTITCGKDDSEERRRSVR